MTTNTSTLILLRHGESEWNAKNLFTGWVDVDLTDTGRQEATRAVNSWHVQICSPTSSTHHCSPALFAPVSWRSRPRTDSGFPSDARGD